MEKLYCKYFSECGNCSTLNVPYETQLMDKTDVVHTCFSKVGLDVNVERAQGMYFPYEFRNKIHIKVTSERGKTLIGFCKENSGKVVNVNGCRMHDKWAETLIALVKTLVSDFKIKPYDEETNKGTLRYVVARKLGNGIMVTLVATTRNFAGKDWFYNQLNEQFKSVSLWLNLNTRTDSAVFDNYFVHLNGAKQLSGDMLGIKFALSPASFFQTNEKIASKMYSLALEKLSENSPDTILDLYSGIGVTSNLFAKVAPVIAVEENGEATRDAKTVAFLNGNAKTIQIINGKCESVLPELVPLLTDKVTNVFLDPAREGVERSALDAILSISPARIVYMSCNPETLARDVGYLLSSPSSPYTITLVRPFDMFPHTPHIETLVCLARK